MPRVLLLGCLFLQLCLPLLGEVTLELSRDTMSMDETVDLYLRSEKRGMFKAPTIPLPDGLEIFSTSQRTQIINGKAEFTQAYTIRATKPGTYSIGPFQTQDGGILPGQKLTVTPATAVRATNDLFVTLDASTESTMIRQTVELTLSIFSRDPIGDINLLNFPEEGFEIGEWQEIRANGRTLNNVRYYQKKFVNRITPTQAGTLEFDPVFRIGVPERGSPRSMLFGPRSVRTERVPLPEPLTLEVREPPTNGRPQGYAGHIGTFSLEAEISPTTVRVGDPITLRVELEGTGSLKQALPPHYETTPEFKVYQPKVVTEDLRRDGLSGRKVLEQVIIPTQPGLEALPQLVFHYYQPDTDSYQSLTAGPFPISVTGEGVTSLTEGSMTRLQDVVETELLGEDLIFLKRTPGNPTSLESLTPGLVFGTGAGLPFALWALTALWFRQREAQQQDPSRKRRQQAPKRLQQRLRALDADEDVWKAVWEVLSGTLQDRLDLPAGELHAQELVPVLPSGMDEQVKQELFDWIQRCEQARFSGGATPDSASIREELKAFLPKLDKEVSK